MDFQTLNLLFKFGKDFGYRRLRSCGISDTECLICSFVYAHPECSQDDAAQALHMDKTTLAKALRTLEDKGFVSRRRDPADMRRKALRITETGTERISAVLDLHDRWFEQVLSVLAPEERRQFDEYFLRLLQAAETLRSEQEKEE